MGLPSGSDKRLFEQLSGFRKREFRLRSVHSILGAARGNVTPKSTETDLCSVSRRWVDSKTIRLRM